ncbi:MAG: D-hexose-6-phosphate mutarotase, partial [Gemmatimonas sp.]
MNQETDTASFITLTAGDGAKARIHLNGAHVTSWAPAGDDEERLFVSAKSGFGPGVSVRGGIPVCFPQFGKSGPLPQHGFARVSPWTVLQAEDGADHAVAVLRLIDNDATRALWPYAFSAELRVAVGQSTLDVALNVTNSGDQPFSFTAALHPYFRVHDAYACTVEGLEGSAFIDGLRGGARAVQPRESVVIDGEIDRVYFDVGGSLVLREPERSVSLEHRGFPDAVVWNPGEQGVARRADFFEGDERRMLCVEAAAIGR